MDMLMGIFCLGLVDKECMELMSVKDDRFPQKKAPRLNSRL